MGDGGDAGNGGNRGGNGGHWDNIIQNVDFFIIFLLYCFKYVI